jgi:hypothetical protein
MVLFFDRNFHSRSAIELHAFAPPLKARRSCMCVTKFISRVSTFLTGAHCKLG